MLYLSGFELYSRWVLLLAGYTQSRFLDSQQGSGHFMEVGGGNSLQQGPPSQVRKW